MVGFKHMVNKEQLILTVFDKDLRAIHFALLIDTCFKYETIKIGRVSKSLFHFVNNEEFLEAERLVSGNRRII